MPEWIDTPGELATVLGIGATGIGILFWIVKTKVNEVLHETRPNSGTSMRDAVDRIEQHIVRIESKIDGHIKWHLEDEK